MGSCRPDQRPDAVTDELWCVEALLAAGCDVSIPVYEVRMCQTQRARVYHQKSGW